MSLPSFNLKLFLNAASLIASSPSNNSELNRLLNLIPLEAASFSMALIKSFLSTEVNSILCKGLTISFLTK